MALVCGYCQRLIAPMRSARSEPIQQIAAYVRHLRGRHGLDKEVAGRVARNTPLQTIKLPELRTAEDRWMKARLMWAEGRNLAEIAAVYGISYKAMRTRVQRWRKRHGWFPPRD